MFALYTFTWTMILFLIFTWILSFDYFLCDEHCFLLSLDRFSFKTFAHTYTSIAHFNTDRFPLFLCLFSSFLFSNPDVAHTFSARMQRTLCLMFGRRLSSRFHSSGVTSPKHFEPLRFGSVKHKWFCVICRLHWCFVCRLFRTLSHVGRHLWHQMKFCLSSAQQ